MTPEMSSWLPMLILVPLIGFGLYRRFKTTFGRQQVAPKRMIFRMVLLAAICVLLAVTSASAPLGWVAAASGLGAGVVLALVGLHLTKLERTAGGTFYVPNGWIGLAVTAIFLGRLATRLVTMPQRMAEAHAGAPSFDGFQRSPLTLAVFFLLAGYYVAFYAGVLTKARSLPAPAPPPAT